MSEAETIGVDLGGTKMQVGVLAGVETLWESRETSRGQDQDELVELLVREVNEAREARPDAVAVGLGIPATINQERGVAIAAVNLPLLDLPVRDVVQERVGLPVFLDNDGNVAAYAEFLYGAARGKPTMVMLTIGTGIGDLIGGRLGVACASFANIFEPEAIVVGGGVIKAGDLLLDPARAEVRARALNPMNKTPILEATLGNDAGMIGAAALARNELEKQQG
jgi:predicted NBD/HSP70 family sugar kinase